MAADAFAANGYGLYNMVGNVWEWTSSSADEECGSIGSLVPRKTLEGGVLHVPSGRLLSLPNCGADLQHHRHVDGACGFPGRVLLTSRRSISPIFVRSRTSVKYCGQGRNSYRWPGTTYPAFTRDAAISPTRMLGAWVFDDGMVGKMDASATLKPSSPITRSSGSTTAILSMPIRLVPTG